MTYMKRFEDNNHVSSVRLCLPEAIFWLRGEMMGQKWVKSESHHFSIVGYNSPIKCAIWVHNTILETSGHLLFSSKFLFRLARYIFKVDAAVLKHL